MPGRDRASQQLSSHSLWSLFRAGKVAKTAPLSTELRGLAFKIAPARTAVLGADSAKRASRR